MLPGSDNIVVKLCNFLYFDILHGLIISKTFLLVHLVFLLLFLFLPCLFLLLFYYCFTIDYITVVRKTVIYLRNKHIINYKFLPSQSTLSYSTILWYKFLGYILDFYQALEMLYFIAKYDKPEMETLATTELSKIYRNLCKYSNISDGVASEINNIGNNASNDTIAPDGGGYYYTMFGSLFNMDYHKFISEQARPDQIKRYHGRFDWLFPDEHKNKWSRYEGVFLRSDSFEHKIAREIGIAVCDYVVYVLWDKRTVTQDDIGALYCNLDTADDIFASVMSLWYFKVTGEFASIELCQELGSLRSATLLVGAIDAQTNYELLGYGMNKKYWRMNSIARSIIFKSREVLDVICDVLNKHNITNKDEIDHIINGFTFQWIGSLLVAGMTGWMNYQLSKSQEMKDKYLSDPCNFTLECARLGATSIAISALRDDTILKAPNGCPFTVPENTVCPFDNTGFLATNNQIFPHASKFDPSRDNLDKDLTVWGDTMTKITDKSSIRACPGYLWAILCSQDVINRKYKFEHQNPTFLGRVWPSTVETVSTGRKKSIHDEKVQKRIDKIHRELDAYSQHMLSLLTPAVRKFNENPILHIPNKSLDSKYDESDYPIKLSKVSYMNGLIKLIEEDENVERDPLKDTVYSLFKSDFLFPIEDSDVHNKFFKNDAELEAFLASKVNLPKRNIDWLKYGGVQSDYAMSLWAFGGNASNLIQVIDKTSETRVFEYSIPENAVFKHDMTYMGNYQTRKGIHVHGACAFFDINYNIISIYVSHLHKMVYRVESDDSKDDSKDNEDRKGDDEIDEVLQEWKFAKWVWLSATVLGVTIVDHALISHIVEANAFVTSARENLPLNHRLRELLRPFTYRTVYINRGADKLLFAKGGIFQRFGGWKYSELARMAKNELQNYEYKPYYAKCDLDGLNKLYSKGIYNNDELDKIYPFIQDSKDYFDLTYSFVEKYLTIVYGDLQSAESQKKCLDDRFCIAFLKQLCDGLKLNYENEVLKRENNCLLLLCELLTSMITSVTSYHEMVGTMGDVACVKPDWIGTKIYKKNGIKELRSPRNDIATTSVLIMLTGVRNPSILNDFSNVFSKTNEKEFNEIKDVLNEWQSSLKQFATIVDERNKKRRIPFQACNPNVMECSVSI